MQMWNVGNLPAGGSATLTVSYFLLQNSAPVAYAQVVAANEQDVDSTPNNGTPPTPNEDDEASTSNSTGICNISATVSNVQCHNNGTPTNPNDDTFTFDVTVNSVGVCMFIQF